MTRRAPAAAGDKNPGKKEATVGRTWRRLSYTPSIQTSIRLLCNYRDCMLPIECTVGVIYFLHFIAFYPIPFRTFDTELEPYAPITLLFFFLLCLFHSYLFTLLSRSLNRSLLFLFLCLVTAITQPVTFTFIRDSRYETERLSDFFTPPSHPFTILCNLSEVLQSSL